MPEASRRLAIAAVVSGILCCAISSAVAQLPRFERHGVAIDPAALTPAPLNYPHDDAIFSSVIDAEEHFSGAKARFYLYFGPHDGPGGVFLAYADAIEGPWTVYDADPSDGDLDPVIGRRWEGHYAVSHVASPHALWIPEEQQMFLWFHGENNVTRYASTEDGIHFQYEGVAVTADDFDDTVEASYARVFREPIPSKNARYVLMLMGNQSGTRPIYLAWSPDARQWTAQRAPMLRPHGDPDEGPQISSPHLLRWKGQKYVVYHQNYLGANPPPGVIWATPITDEFVQAGEPQAFVEPLPDEDANHVWAPSFIAAGDRLYIFYDSGPRLNCKIRYASTPLPDAAAGGKSRTHSAAQRPNP